MVESTTASTAVRNVLNLSSKSSLHSGPGRDDAKLVSKSTMIAEPSGTDAQKAGKVDKSVPRS